MRLIKPFKNILTLALIMLSAALMAWSWIDFRCFLSIWFGYALFFLLTARLQGWRSFLTGGAIGLGVCFIAFHWVPSAFRATSNSGVPFSRALFCVMLAWEATPFAITAAFASRQLRLSTRRAWRIPVLWVALETFWPKVFPWTVAHTQTDAAAFLQIAEIVGLAGVSFVFISITVLPSLFFIPAFPDAVSQSERPLNKTRNEKKWRFAYAIVCVVMLGGTLGFGFERLNYWERRFSSENTVRTAVIQVVPHKGDSVAKARIQTLAIEEHLDLALWPESMLGAHSQDLRDFKDESVTRHHSFPPFGDLHPTYGLPCEILVGGKTFGSDARKRKGPFCQTAFLVNPEEVIVAHYKKRSLMPVGEYVPGEKIMPFLRTMADLREESVTGSEASPVRLQGGGQVGILLCYGDIAPDNARESVEEGAQLLVTLANGSSFENPLTLEQHMRLALPRAIENRRYFARSTATGVSCVISPTGKILQQAKPNCETTLVADLPLLSAKTFYNRFGYWLAPCLLCFSIFWFVRGSHSWFRTHRKALHMLMKTQIGGSKKQEVR